MVQQEGQQKNEFSPELASQPTEADFSPEVALPAIVEAIPTISTPTEKSGATTPASDTASSGVVATPASVTPAVKDEALQEIEEILQDDLEEVYANLPEETKQEFKAEGEKAAWEIRGLLSQVKVKAKKIFGVVASWLKIIPGINKFFLEQEAKIKTDEILDLADKDKTKT